MPEAKPTATRKLNLPLWSITRKLNLPLWPLTRKLNLPLCQLAWKSNLVRLPSNVCAKFTGKGEGSKLHNGIILTQIINVIQNQMFLNHIKDCNQSEGENVR